MSAAAGNGGARALDGIVQRSGVGVARWAADLVLLDDPATVAHGTGPLRSIGDADGIPTGAVGSRGDELKGVRTTELDEDDEDAGSTLKWIGGIGGARGFLHARGDGGTLQQAALGVGVWFVDYALGGRQHRD